MATANPSKTTTTTTTLDLHWQSTTDRILGQPVKSLTEGRWNEALHVMTYWFGNRDDASRKVDDAMAMEACWKILDRLCLELENTPNSNQKGGPPRLSTTEVLNPILVLWRDDFLAYHKNQHSGNRSSSSKSLPPLLPSAVADKIQTYQRCNLVELDAATHAILLDAAGKYSAILSQGTAASGERIGEVADTKQLDHSQGVLFADRYLREWIDDYYESLNANNNHNSIKSKLPSRPDIVAFGTLMHAWVESGLPGAPNKAEAWVKTLDDLEGKHPNNNNNNNNTFQSTNKSTETRQGSDNDEGRRILYTNVLLAWAREGNPVKAKEWIDRMISEKEYPDVQAFNRLLMAYQSAASKFNNTNHPNKNSNNYAERAEEVLKHMQKLYHEPTGFLSQPPNAFSYNIVIDTWTKRASIESSSGSFRSGGKRKDDKAIDAAKRAHGLFEQMKNAGIAPNTIAYNTVITAYSRAGLPQESEKLLQEMIAIYQNQQDGGGGGGGSNDPSLTSHRSPDNHDSGNLGKYTSMTTTKPDVQSFTSILAGWARVGTLEAAERAEELLRLMQRPEVNIEPNVETYGSCIHCWARVVGGTHARGRASRGQRERAVSRAEALFREMKEEQNISPDVYSYTSLLNVYGRSGRSRKAHAFLEDCLREYDRTTDPRMKPTVVTFTAILNAWSKATNAPEASERAHELLHRMKDEYGIEPNAFSYSSVLDAYSRSDRPDAATKALSLFRDMRAVGGLEPNSYTCSNVLKAMARGRMVEEAEDLLLELVHDEGVRDKLGPHAISAVLYGWSKSKRQDAPERAEQLVMKMQELYRKKMIDGPPNSVCWNNVLACWAHSDLPGAAQRADDMLRRIQQQQKEERDLETKESRKGHRQRPRGGGAGRDNPSTGSNRIMYNTVMNAWANNGNFEKANDLYRELLEQHQTDPNLSPPDEYTYRALWKSIVKDNQMGREEKLNRLETVVQTMTDVGLKPNKNMDTDLERFRSQKKHREK
jgi:pentatricopeptide repeat protein